jgi:hypothetical protein
MDRFEWNSLRTDSPVVVHVRPDFHLVEGRIGIVRARRWRNEIGIRLHDGDTVWPNPGEIHSVPRDDDSDRCWRCAFRRTPTPWSSGTTRVA